jgi:hypothetical protein
LARLTNWSGQIRTLIGRKKKIMGMRKTAIVALIALVGAGASILPIESFAQRAPGASATANTQTAASLSAADKAALLKKLKDAKKH